MKWVNCCHFIFLISCMSVFCFWFFRLQSLVRGWGQLGTVCGIMSITNENHSDRNLETASTALLAIRAGRSNKNNSSVWLSIWGCAVSPNDVPWDENQISFQPSWCLKWWLGMASLCPHSSSHWSYIKCIQELVLPLKSPENIKNI